MISKVEATILPHKKMHWPQTARGERVVENGSKSRRKNRKIDIGSALYLDSTSNLLSGGDHGGFHIRDHGGLSSRTWRTQFEIMALSIPNMALLYLADDYFKCPLPTRLPRSSFCVYKCVNIEKYIGDAGSSKMILGRLLSLCNQYRQFINLALYSKRRFF